MPALASLILADDAWSNWAIVFAGVTLSIFLERRFAWAAKVSGPVIALAIAMALSNTGICAHEPSVLPVIEDWLVPLAIPLLLFEADLLRILRCTGKTLVAFHLAALGTVLGALLAGVLLGPLFPAGWVPGHAAGIITASYTGGMVNFVAVRDTFAADATMSSTLFVCDNAVMAAAFVLLFALAGSRFVLQRYPHPHIEARRDALALAAPAVERERAPALSVLDLAKSLAVAWCIAAVAMKLSAALRGEGFLRALAGNRFVLLTTLTLAGATLLPRFFARLRGGRECGALLLYVFLFSIGFPADLGLMAQNGALLLAFCATVAAVNIAVTLGAGKLLRLPLEDLLIACNATLGGPPTALAMAITMGWGALVVPALLVALWGYVIGTVVGIATGHALLG